MSPRIGHVLSALACIALVGCVSDGPNTILVPGTTGSGGDGAGGGGGGTTTSSSSSGNPGGTTPQEYFEQTVYPELNMACGSCHVAGVGVPYFLGTDANTSYGKVASLPGYVADPANSRLLLKGEHFGGDAPALTAEQATIVTTWLDKELEENPDGVGGPVELTPLQQLEKFGQCISFADFELYPLQELANQQVIVQNNGVECDSCHQEQDGLNGREGTAITPVAENMFYLTRKMPWIMKFATVTLNEDGTFKDIVRANRWIEKCVEEPLLGSPHPPCVNTTIDANVVGYINGLFDMTHERFMADECDLATTPEDTPEP